MKIIFACAGNQTRWNNYMNYNKHLVPINGMPLLKRNINLFKKILNIDTYYVSIRNENMKPIYNVDDNIIFYIPDNIPEGEPSCKTLLPFINSCNDDVLLLLGDVIYSEDCVKKINDAITNQSFNVFGRKRASNITSCKWGELFAFYIPVAFKPEFTKAVNMADYLYKRRYLSRFSGWELISYIYVTNKTTKNIQKEIKRVQDIRLFPESFIEIDDTTEDFDFPSDYDSYLTRKI